MPRQEHQLGNPRWDDDGYSEKLNLICEQAVPVISLTFGCPTPSQVNRLQSSGSAVWVTVTTVGEAQAAQRAGADGLVVQGMEGGGHRGGFDDANPGDIGLLALLQLVQATVDDALPMVAAGGLMTGWRDDHGSAIRTARLGCVVTQLVTHRLSLFGVAGRNWLLTWWAILGSNQ
jgi:nitronate monooxygenase